jgi:hypothetical protein
VGNGRQAARSLINGGIDSRLDFAPPEAIMEYRVSYEHSLASAPDDFIVHIPSQLVTDVPADVPREALPDYLTDLIRHRSPRIGKIRNLRLL